MSSFREYARLRGTLLAASLLAWAALVALAGRGSAAYCTTAATGTGWGGPAGASGLAFALAWGLMLAAMLAPMLVSPLYFVYLSSFARLRLRLMILSAIGFAVVWMLGGTVVAVAQLAMRASFSGPWWPVLLVGALAVVWQASPWKKACLNRCHVHRPIAAFGLAAHRDALRVGFVHGLWCVGSCWLNMLWPMLLPVGHSLGMAAAALLMYCERLDPGAVPAWRLRGFRTASGYAAWIWRRLRQRHASAPVAQNPSLPGRQTPLGTLG